MTMTTYTLAGGCFWCMEAVYQQFSGVESILNGYTGGSAEDASYYRVASGQTNHAEAVQIRFDEAVIPTEVILDMFFLIHNPTTLNQQGADVGSQYRSAMFYQNELQKSDFKAALDRAQVNWDDTIVTEIAKLDKFYEAEPEHFDYYTNNPTNPYCSAVITPKVLKARSSYSHWLKS